MTNLFRRLIVPMVALALVLSPLAGTGSSSAQQRQPQAPNVSKLRVPKSQAGMAGPDSPTRVRPTVDRSLKGRRGAINVVVQLKTQSLAEKITSYNAVNAADFTGAQQRSYLPTVSTSQSAFINQARTLGGSPLARVQKALNAVILRIDASKVEALAALPNVKSVRPVQDYELDLSETVPYIGATAVQNGPGRFNGAGVRVAVLDSGVDYTHQDLGGPGTVEAYNAAYGTQDPTPTGTPPTAPPESREVQERDGLFPTAKVYEGFDFVGERWPVGPRTEDPDPIDFDGHGTHVADIIAGVAAPRDQNGEATQNNSTGVAPGASVLAVKVCSAIAGSCNGVALIKAVDYLLDPNGDGDVADKVDVANLSLGSSYGQKEDDLTEALRAAVGQGVVVVASAGNSGNRPYIAGSPSVGPEIISVAQTQVPSAIAYPLNINEPPSIAGRYNNTATVDFAPVTGNSPQDPNDTAADGWTNAETVYVGTACPGQALTEDPAGKVAVVRRGACSISLKVEQAAEQGAIGVLIALSAEGDAVSFSYGGSDDDEYNAVPSLVITKDPGDKIQEARAAGTTVRTTVNSQNSVSLRGSVVGSSSRGPSFSFNEIKPDIGAPGASVSAEAGTASIESAFGGTSGAAPMVAGSAVLLKDRYPGRTPAEIKALLMNTAETNIKTNPLTSDALAPITRIGGGEVRVDRAINSTTAAYDADAPGKGGSLSFRYQRVVNNTITLTKNVRVVNYGGVARTYTIDPRFRYNEDDPATPYNEAEAVRVTAPETVTAPARGSATFPVTMTIQGAKLHEWNINGGVKGGDAGALGTPEYDGYISLSAGPEFTKAHVAFHVLPHKSAAQTPNRTSTFTRDGVSNQIQISNAQGATRGRVESFAFVGSSPPKKFSTLPGPGDNRAASVDLRRAGVREVIVGRNQDGSFQYGVQFGVFTAGYRAHPNYPAEFDIFIDTDRNDATGGCAFGAEYVVFNGELGGFAATGQNVVSLFDCATGTATPRFFTDADLNSNTAILTAALGDLRRADATVPGGSRPLTRDDQFDFEVLLFDNYFTGAFEDAIGEDANGDSQIGPDEISTLTFTPSKPRYFGELVESGAVEEGVPVGGSETFRVTEVGTAADSPSVQGLLLFYRDPRFGREGNIIAVNPGATP